MASKRQAPRVSANRAERFTTTGQAATKRKGVKKDTRKSLQGGEVKIGRGGKYYNKYNKSTGRWERLSAVATKNATPGSKPVGATTKSGQRSAVAGSVAKAKSAKRASRAAAKKPVTTTNSSSYGNLAKNMGVAKGGYTQASNPWAGMARSTKRDTDRIANLGKAGAITAMVVGPGKFAAPLMGARGAAAGVRAATVVGGRGAAKSLGRAIGKAGPSKLKTPKSGTPKRPRGNYKTPKWTQYGKDITLKPNKRDVAQQGRLDTFMASKGAPRAAERAASAASKRSAAAKKGWETRRRNASTARRKK